MEGQAYDFYEALYGYGLRWRGESGILQGQHRHVAGRCQEDVRGHPQRACQVNEKKGKRWEEKVKGRSVLERAHKEMK